MPHRNLVRDFFIGKFLENIYDSIITNFNQSFSEELLENPNFTIWIDDNPSGYTVGGENAGNPEVTQRASNQSHASEPAGLESANFFSSATNSQPRVTQVILEVGHIYEINSSMTTRVSGNFAFGGLSLGANNFTTVGNTRLIGRANNTSFVLQMGNAPSDITINSLSVKEIIKNSEIITPNNCLLDFSFLLPQNTGINEEINHIYRMPNSGDELNNGYSAYLRRRTGNTSWDFRVDRFANAVRTNKLNVSNIGNNVNAIRVKLTGDLHELQTRNAGVWVTRGSFTDDTYNTAILSNVLYPSNVTPLFYGIAS